MNWFNVLWHDLRNGLLRWRQLLIPIIFLIPCFLGNREFSAAGISASWGDYLLYCFKGQLPISANTALQDISLPTLWILVVGSCLYLNLDYLPKDMTSFGLQIIYRCRNKAGWFLSKCLWNAMSCLLYLALACLTTFLFSWFAGASSTMAASSQSCAYIFQSAISDPISLSIRQTSMVTVLLPFLTIFALSMLEMLLCMITKPILAFLSCMLLLAFAAFGSSRWFLGVGAMSIRSSYVTAGGASPLFSACFAIGMIIACILIGVAAFRKADILSIEE